MMGYRTKFLMANFITAKIMSTDCRQWDPLMAAVWVSSLLVKDTAAAICAVSHRTKSCALRVRRDFVENVPEYTRRVIPSQQILSVKKRTKKYSFPLSESGIVHLLFDAWVLLYGTLSWDKNNSIKTYFGKTESLA